jgi:hypothetical protein
MNDIDNIPNNGARPARQALAASGVERAPRVKRRAENRGAARSRSSREVHAAFYEKRLVLHCSIEAVAANVQSGSFDEPGLHVKAAGFADPVEQIGFRRGHPNLPLIHEAGEERRTSPLVEMRRNFVEKEDGGLIAPLCHQLRVGQHQAEKQGLLLTRRAA